GEAHVVAVGCRCRGGHSERATCPCREDDSETAHKVLLPVRVIQPSHSGPTTASRYRRGHRPAQGTGTSWGVAESTGGARRCSGRVGLGGCSTVAAPDSTAVTVPMSIRCTP